MLDLRLATWVAMGVPISFLGAVIFFAPFDVNINMISLFGLIIVLGLVVDDAVVVGETLPNKNRRRWQCLGTQRSTWGIWACPCWSAHHYGGVCALIVRYRNLWTDPRSVPIVVILVLTMSLLEVFLICQRIYPMVVRGVAGH